MKLLYIPNRLLLLIAGVMFLLEVVTSQQDTDKHDATKIERDEDSTVAVRSLRMMENQPTNAHPKGKCSKHNLRARRETVAEEESASDEDVRAIVQYSSEEGRELARSAAKQIIKDFDDMLVVILTKDSMRELQGHYGIKNVEMDNPVEGFHAMDEEYHETRFLREKVPYGIHMVEADQLTVGSFIPTVCIVDTGYALGHPDLPSDPNLVNGTSRLDAFQGTQQWLWNVDENGHGTHIAGVIAALSGNNKGVMGSGNIKLHIARGLSDVSRAYETDILEAIQDCIDAKANIISLSLGGNGMSQAANDLYRRAVEEHNVIVVAAAGNHGRHLHQYPASHPSVISVTAVYEWKKYWSGSNWGNQVELAAPGHRILSTTTTNTAVHTFDFSFPANIIYDSPTHVEVSGPLVYCGVGNNGLCYGASGGICLMVHESNAKVDNMVANCVSGGGVGAIFFSDSVDDGYWYAVASPIPLVRVTTERGEALLKLYENKQVSLGFRQESDVKEYTYNYFTGTSMAVPHVAAVSALVWSHFPECTNHQIRYALAASAQDQGLTGCDWDYGYGIVKAKAAYDFLKQHGCNSSLISATKSRGGCSTL